MKLSIIIPAYNEEKTISNIIKKVSQIKIPESTIEIIVVDDGSTDTTFSKINEIKTKISNIRILRHGKNQGKGAAVKTGIENAKGDYIVIQDADLEYDPKFIPVLVDPIKKEKAQVIYGTRLKSFPNIFKAESKLPHLLFLIHYFGNRMLSLLTSILYGQWVTDMETGYKVFPRKALENITLHAKSFDFEPEITAKLLKKGYNILEIPITTTPRGYGQGKKLHTIRDGTIALWTLFKYKFLS